MKLPLRQAKYCKHLSGSFYLKTSSKQSPKGQFARL